MASSSSVTQKYDVFLNFRGIDTRDGFTSLLYESLRLLKVNTFIDMKLERGEEISSALLQEIESSSISVVIFSKNYAFSPYCLDEMVKIIECKESMGQSVLPVFYKVDPTDIEELRGSFGEAFSEHQERFNVENEKLEKWKSALQKAASLAGWLVTDNMNEHICVRRIVSKISEKLNKKHATQTGQKMLPTKGLVGQKFRSKMDSILEWLSNGEVSSVGICGMGGVGKTTLMTHVHNELLKKPRGFSQVYWVAISQDFSVTRLQSLIAKTIKIDLDIEENERKRAAILLEELQKRSKFVLIIDDLWNHFDLREVGIPIENNGCKLFVTTRSIEVCRRMNFQKVAKVEPLKEEEGWDLFVKTFECKLSPNVEMIAKSIVKECAGLPLAIVTMAGSMRGVDNLYEWKNALTELRRSIRQEEMEEEVFRILRYSYTRLNDSALQQCLLYVALFPEDYFISMERLVIYLIVEGIIDQDRDTREEQISKGYTTLYKLVNVSLLEQEVKQKYLKMHDLIRDMAIQIMKEQAPSIVEAGKQLQYVPDAKQWRKDIVRVSLVKNEIKIIPSNFIPRCPKLSTLLLSENKGLVSIGDSFYDQLQGLKVLDLSHTSIEKLPESIACLKNLTALIVRIPSLTHIPTLANLTSLELLDLHGCSKIGTVPEGLELLSNLRQLDLVGSGVTEFPGGLLPKLSHLQFLAFHQPSNNVKELGSLQRLETLHWSFSSIRNLTAYLHLLSEMPTKHFKYRLSVGSKLGPKILDYGLDVEGHKVILTESILSRELADLNFQIDKLALREVILENGLGLCLQNPIGLKSLSIDGCDGIEYVFSVLRTLPSILQSLESLSVANMHGLKVLFPHLELMVPRAHYSALSFGLKALKFINCDSVKGLLPGCLLSNLHNLETLQVVHCYGLEEIISVDENSRALTLSLPNLRELILYGVPKLKRICDGQIKCDNLVGIHIFDCHELNDVSICLPLPHIRTVEVTPRSGGKE